jgi:hypothetical protein
MSNGKDRNESAEVDLLLQKARAVFDESVDSLDGQARSRLNRGRQAALAELDSGTVSLGRWTRWAPAAGAAVVAVVAVVLLHGSPDMDQFVNPEAAQLDGDFELLIAEDSFDMLLELEFYSWVDIDAAMEDESGMGADVG